MTVRLEQSKLPMVLTITNMHPSNRRPYYGTFIQEHHNEFQRRGIPGTLVADRGEYGSRLQIVRKYLGIFARSLIASFRHRYDVVHAHFIFPTGLIGHIVAKIHGAQLVVTSHGGDLAVMPHRSPAHRWLTQYILSSADRIIAVSHDLRDIMVNDYAIDPEKVTVIDMGVSMQKFFVTDKANAKRIIGVAPDRLIVLFVGIAFKNKGGLEILEAISGLGDTFHQNADFYVIGAKDLVQHRARISSLGAERWMHYLGLLPHDSVVKWLKAADLLLLPSFSEGLPIALLEGMASGCAVVSTPVGGIPLLVEHGETGLLVEPGAVPALAEAIRRCITDSDLRHTLSTGARRRAAQFAVEKKVDEVLAIYRSPE